MKFFNVLAFVCLFFFLVGCEESPKRLIPVDEPDSGSSEITDDTDNPDTAVDPTTEPAYCSAVFNGSTSKVEVAHNDALNLNSDSWTIEAWIKQVVEDVSEEVPIVAKKGSGNQVGYTYMLSHYYYKAGGWGSNASTAMKGSAYYTVMMASEISAEATGLANSGEWTHVALVQNMASSFMKKPQVTLYINVKKAKSAESNVTSNVAPSIATSTDVLLIGSTGSKAFNGLIDSVRISNTAKYTNQFTPDKLSADSDTIAFWDFNGSTDDTIGGFNGIPTDITYSEDCK